MALRWHFGLVFGSLLFVSSLHAQFAFAPRKHQDMEAVLAVEAGMQTAERGLGNVTLTLTIVGPSTLDVEEPRLGDAAAAWKQERVSPTIAGDKLAYWSQVIHLQQVRRGIEPVPDVTVRFRREPEAEWIEEKWIDIIRNTRDGAETPRPLQPEPSWLRRWGFVLVLAAAFLLILLAWLRKRWRFRPRALLSPDRWAIREIERIESSLLPPKGAAEAYHTQLSFVVRRYLAERFGLPALQQTTAEFLESIRKLPQLTAHEQALLAQLSARCDLAKFARAGTSPEECRRTAELARALLRPEPNGD